MAGEEKFVNTINKFTHLVGVRADFVVQKLAFDAFAGLLGRTPVDTGRARASWRLGINRVNLSVSPERSRSNKKVGQGPASKGEIAEQTKGLTAEYGDTIHITNNLPYIEVLESGTHSAQAPAGMLRITFFELTVKLNRTLALAKLKAPDVRS